MTEQPTGLFKSAIKDPAVRLAALCGAGVGAVLVFAVIMLVGGPQDQPMQRDVIKAEGIQQQARIATVNPSPVARVVQPTPPPSENWQPSAPPVETYPELPVSRVDEPDDTLGPREEALPQATAKAMPEDVSPRPLPEAVPPSPAAKPLIAIVIDDMGVDQRRSARAMTLPGKVTLSFLPYARDLKAQTAQAAKSGHEVMLHVAMEPESAEADPGPNVLLTGVPKDELLKSLRWNLDQMTGYAGINNHMGSRFTRDLAGMRVVMAELKARGLFFLDSVTSRDSVGSRAAREAGVPYASRDIFIDHKDEMDFVMKQLDKTAARARKQGIAIAIGHPRDITLRVLKAWIPKVLEQGFELVGISRVLHRPRPAHSGTAGTSG
ncbi:MAG: divergent polysaccharide deacetylase family protein [Rhodospirillales bacterium]